jgi:hypothetical protein
MAIPGWEDENQCETHSHHALLAAAEGMAAAITILVHRNLLDARSLPADALLDYMQEVNGGFSADCWSEEEAVARLQKTRR